MKYYFSAQISIHDYDEYELYLKDFDEIFEKYHGRFLAVDEEPQLLEGEWNYTKSVLIEFDSKKDFDEWYYSPGYQRILAHRLKAAICNSILIRGLE